MPEPNFPVASVRNVTPNGISVKIRWLSELGRGIAAIFADFDRKGERM
jgi:hypothetical protein